MNVKIILLGFFLFCCLNLTQAQQGTKIKFDETTHQFGKIMQNDPAVHTFTFTNVSDEAITLSRVKASCGCTTPSWTREPVEAGKKGEIKVKYNTNRVGPFTKTVTVNYSAETKPIILYIKGEVKSDGLAADGFLYRQGGLAFDKLNYSIGTLDSDKEKVASFKIKNIGPQPITINGEYEHEMMIKINPKKNTLNPGEITTLQVQVIGDRFITPGSFSKQISLFTDETDSEKKITISGTLNKVFTAEELAAMPNIRFEKTSYNAGTVLEGEEVEFTYKFVNTGKQDLIIESVKASCGCTASSPKDKVVKAGQASEIIAKFNSRGRQGKQAKSITVRSNDPDNGTVVLRLNVEVEKNPFHVNDVGPAATSGGRK